MGAGTICALYRTISSSFKSCRLAIALEMRWLCGAIFVGRSPTIRKLKLFPELSHRHHVPSGSYLVQTATMKSKHSRTIVIKLGIPNCYFVNLQERVPFAMNTLTSLFFRICHLSSKHQCDCDEKDTELLLCLQELSELDCGEWISQRNPND